MNAFKTLFARACPLLPQALLFAVPLFQSRLLVTHLSINDLNNFYLFIAVSATSVVFSLPSNQDFQIKSLLQHDEIKFWNYTIIRIIFALLFLSLSSSVFYCFKDIFQPFLFLSSLCIYPFFISLDIFPLLLQARGHLFLFQCLAFSNALMIFLALRHTILSNNLDQIFFIFVASKGIVCVVSFITYVTMTFSRSNFQCILQSFRNLRLQIFMPILGPQSYHILNTFLNVGLSKLDIFALSLLDNGMYLSSYSIAMQVPNSIKTLLKPYMHNILIKYCNSHSKLPNLFSNALCPVYLFSGLGFIGSVSFSFFYLNIFLDGKLPAALTISCILSIPLLYSFVGNFYSQGQFYLGSTRLVLYCSIFSQIIYYSLLFPAVLLTGVLGVSIVQVIRSTTQHIIVPFLYLKSDKTLYS